MRLEELTADEASGRRPGVRGEIPLIYSATNQTGGASSVQFKGTALVIVLMYERGAARIQADFDHTFTSCTANVIRGKALGNSTRIAKGLVTGTRFEVESSSTSDVTCAIKDSNVFAE